MSTEPRLATAILVTTGRGEDDGPDGGVVLGAFEGRGDAGTDGVRQAVDRWVGEGNDRDSALDSVVDLSHSKMS